MSTKKTAAKKKSAKKPAAKTKVAPKQPAKNELRARVLSGGLLGAAALFITWWESTSFNVLLMLGAVVLFKEWTALTRHRHGVFFPLGVLYIGLACISLAAIRQVYGWQMVMLLFALVWSADIAAYFVGKRIGKHKIAPTVSPGKTWEGFDAALIANAFIVTLVLLYCPSLAILFHSIQEFPGHYSDVFYLFPFYFPAAYIVVTALITGGIFAGVGLLGDLFESSLKRHAGVKDSGALIPGHGGLFDRVDALLSCSILAAILLFY